MKIIRVPSKTRMEKWKENENFSKHKWSSQTSTFFAFYIVTLMVPDYLYRFYQFHFFFSFFLLLFLRIFTMKRWIFFKLSWMVQFPFSFAFECMNMCVCMWTWIYTQWVICLEGIVVMFGGLEWSYINLKKIWNFWGYGQIWG